MDSGGKNRFFSGDAKINRRGGGCPLPLAHSKVKALTPIASELLRFQIIFIKQRRGEKAAQVDLHPLTEFVDDTQLHGWVRAVHKVSDGGLRYAAFHIELILRHAALLHQLDQPSADCFI